MAANSGSEVADGKVRKYFGVIKGAETVILQAWRGQGRRGGSRV